MPSQSTFDITYNVLLWVWDNKIIQGQEFRMQESKSQGLWTTRHLDLDLQNSGYKNPWPLVLVIVTPRPLNQDKVPEGYWMLRGFFAKEGKPIWSYLPLSCLWSTVWNYWRCCVDEYEVLIRWFEELGPICELLEKASEIRASKIKSPTGRVFQKYVYTCFIVKMRINFGSLGLF